MSGEDPVPGHLLAVPSHGGERAPVFSSPLAGYQSHHGSPTLMILFNSLPKTPPPDTIAWGLGGANTQSAAAMYVTWDTHSRLWVNYLNFINKLFN